MSGNRGVAVTISVVDRVTNSLRAINKRIDHTVAPFRRLRREMAHFARSSGLEATWKRLKGIGSAALNAARSVTRVIAPLSALSAAASLGGIVRMTLAWSDFGMQLGITSTNLGIAPRQLMSLQGAARLAGTSAETLNSAMANLGQTLTDARAGRNPEFIAHLQALGFTIKDLNKSSTQMLPEIADKIKAIKNPFLQKRVSEWFFGGAGDGMLPFLREGSKGMRAYERIAERYNTMTGQQVRQADKLYQAQTKLSLATQGFGNTLAATLAPAMVPILTDMARWIRLNKQWISTGISQQVVAFSKAIEGIPFRKLELIFGNAFDPAGNSAASILGGLFSKTGNGFVSPQFNALNGWSQWLGKKVHQGYDWATDGPYSTKPLPGNVRSQVRNAAKRYGLDPNLMTALARAEGGTGKTSPKGAIGTMQLMPSTALGLGVNPWDQQQNVDGGMRYYRQLLKQFHGNQLAAAAAYNAGPANSGVQIYAQTGQMWALPLETQRYVRTIRQLAAARGDNLSVPGARQAGADSTAKPASGKAHLHVTLHGFPASATQTHVDATGDLWGAPPKVSHAMPGGGLP